MKVKTKGKILPWSISKTEAENLTSALKNGSLCIDLDDEMGPDECPRLAISEGVKSQGERYWNPGDCPDADFTVLIDLPSCDKNDPWGNDYFLAFVETLWTEAKKVQVQTQRWRDRKKAEYKRIKTPSGRYSYYKVELVEKKTRITKAEYLKNKKNG